MVYDENKGLLHPFKRYLKSTPKVRTTDNPLICEGIPIANAEEDRLPTLAIYTITVLYVAKLLRSGTPTYIAARLAGKETSSRRVLGFQDTVTSVTGKPLPTTARAMSSLKASGPEDALDSSAEWGTAHAWDAHE